MASSNVGYSGQVTVKVTNKSPVVRKNAGTDKLFNLLAKIMSGQNTWTYENLPSKIDILCNNQTILLSKLSISQQFVKDYTVTLSALLNGSNVKDKTASGDATLQLLDSNNITLATIPDFKLDDIQTVLTDSYAQCKIEWSMSFANITSEE